MIVGRVEKRGVHRTIREEACEERPPGLVEKGKIAAHQNLLIRQSAKRKDIAILRAAADGKGPIETTIGSECGDSLCGKAVE